MISSRFLIDVVPTIGADTSVHHLNVSCERYCDREPTILGQGPSNCDLGHRDPPFLCNFLDPTVAVFNHYICMRLEEALPFNYLFCTSISNISFDKRISVSPCSFLTQRTSEKTTSQWRPGNSTHSKILFLSYPMSLGKMIASRIHTYFQSG